jgi:hypothetical protein
MAEDPKKSASLKVDETIEAVLRFLLRYLRTLGRLTCHPRQAMPLLADQEADPPVVIRPLTFLTIGAFLFALLIDVYPEGRIYDYIWVAGEIRENVNKRWKEAISLTTLITAGLPTIIATAVVGAASARLFFRDQLQRSAWFDLTCYAVGYQTAMVFVILSLESVVSGLVIVFPWLERIALPDALQGWLSLALLVTLAAASIVVPLLLLASFLVAARHPPTRGKAAAVLLAALAYWVAAQYVYTAVASVLPQLNSRYFPKPVADAYALDSPRYDMNGDRVRISFAFLIENKTDEDVLLELDGTSFEIHLARGPDQPKPEMSWRSDGVAGDAADAASGKVRRVIAKKSKAIVPIDVAFAARGDICRAFSSRRAADESAHHQGALLNLYLHASRLYRTARDSVGFSTLLDTDALCR